MGSHAIIARLRAPTQIGSQPGLKLFFPPLPQRNYPGPELSWDLTAGTGLLDTKTRVDSWFTIGGQTTALVRAWNLDGSLPGTYLVLGTGRLLWARVVVAGKRPGVLEARLVAACDGLILEPAVPSLNRRSAH